MVTTKSVRLISAEQPLEYDYEFKGISDDDKPTDGVAVNSLFFELDTGDNYYYDGDQWLKVGGDSSSEELPQ